MSKQKSASMIPILKKRGKKKTDAPPPAEAPVEPSGAEPVTAPAPEAAPAKKGKKPKEAKPKKVSALDAAAKVLADSGTPMTCGELIVAMAEKKLWTSPGGKTPAATLYSALLREINTKGKDARFTKTERGKFAAKT